MFYQKHLLSPHNPIFIDEFTFKVYQSATDFVQISSWFTSEHGAYWGMTKLTTAELQAALEQTATEAGFLVYQAEKLVAYIEVYDPSEDEIGKHHDFAASDFGMHLMMAPIAAGEQPIHNLSSLVFRAILSFVFNSFNAKQVVVEPDVNNTKIDKLNKKYNVVYKKELQLKKKKARLGFFQLATFIKQQGQQQDANTVANLQLVAKMISEFYHEKLLTVVQVATGQYHLYITYKQQALVYQFSAKLYELNHLAVTPLTITHYIDGKQQPVDAVWLVIYLQNRLNIAQSRLPVYLNELINTLHAATVSLKQPDIPVFELINCDFQTIEAAMTRGHPVFVANNGRLGFDSEDMNSYTPAMGNKLRLVWVAVHKSISSFSKINTLNYEDFMLQQLEAVQLEEFNNKLLQLNVQPTDYYMLPVHPWQWREKITTEFSSYINMLKIIYLGVGQEHQPQQSIRTLFNVDAPEKPYVKTALSVLNMGFVRGLSPAFMQRTPLINEFVAAIVENDAYFTDCNFYILKEIAALGCTHPYYAAALTKHDPRNKMLAALWRESPYAVTATGKPVVNRKTQRLMTFAALLHQDQAGASVPAALIKASGLASEDWFAKLLHLYLQPLLHSFFTYDLAYMPHGENLILVLENHVPVKLFVKDIGEEVVLLNSNLSVPAELTGLHTKTAINNQLNYILLDIFDSVLRFMIVLLVEETELTQDQCWQLVAQEIKAYQARFPELAEKYQQLDLFTQSIELAALNRVQLNNNLNMIDLDDREQNLVFTTPIVNPIYRYK